MSIPALTNDFPGPNISEPEALVDDAESLVHLMLRAPKR